MADEVPTTNGEEVEIGGTEVTQGELDSNALHDELVMKQQEAIDKEVGRH